MWPVKQTKDLPDDIPDITSQTSTSFTGPLVKQAPVKQTPVLPDDLSDRAISQTNTSVLT